MDSLSGHGLELLANDQEPVTLLHDGGYPELVRNLRAEIGMVAETSNAMWMSGQPIIVTQRGQPIAVLSAIDAEEFYDYVLAHGPEFVRGRQEADDAIARGELGVPLADVMAELDAEDRGDRRSA